jgi:hypothetical protein
VGKEDAITRLPIEGSITLSDIQYKLNGSQLQLVDTKPIGTGVYQCDVTVKEGIVGMMRYIQFRGKSIWRSILILHFVFSPNKHA